MTVKSLARKVTQLSKDTREVKRSRYLNTPAPPAWNMSSTAFIIKPYTGLAPGPTGVGEFNGDSIRWRSLQMNFNVRIEGAPATTALQQVRIIAWIEHEHTSTGVPSLTHVLKADPNVAEIYQGYNYERKGQFTVIYDKNIALGCRAGDKQQYHVNRSIRVPKKCSLANWSVTNGHFNTNAIFVAFMSDQGTASTNPTIAPQGYLRMTYYD